MVLFHKSFTYICKPIKQTRVNNFILSIGIKLLSTEIQVAPKPKLRTFIQQKKNENQGVGKRFSIYPMAWVLMVMPVTAFGLGVWQIMRKIEKNEMNRVLKKKSETPPVELPKDLNELKDMEFRLVKVKGKFDHSKELYLGPRPLSTDTSHSPESLFSFPKGGYFVVTPFTLSDRNLTIHVNRGWVPGHKKSPQSRLEGQITEEIELVGFVRLSERRQPLGLKNHPEKGIWFYRDLEAMSEITNAAPILIEAVQSSSVPGGPLGGQTVVSVKDDHLTYMVTWFGLSLVTAWMWYNRYIRKAKVAHGLVF